MAFKRYVCWETDQVHQVLNPDAEYTADEIFLAVHSEHPLWMIDPNDPHKRWQQDAHSFLAEFLAPNRHHVQVAVTGGSGSGKSHLIHWMKLSIPPRQDQYVLSIPRSGTSLRGILEIIIKVLPSDRQRKYRERLEMAGYYNENRAQRRERLLDEIALAIQSDNPRDDSPDSQTERWLIENLPHLFHDPYYRQQYTPGQTGIIDQLVTHITEAPQEYHRITERRAFRRDDLPRRGVDVAKMSEVARNFFTPLLSMPEYLDMAVEIINRNLDAAIGRMLNFTGDQLIQLMREVRNFLYHEGKKLILLIEDFARTQGIDGALLEALIEAGGMDKDELCELRWAMAVTTGYYERLPNTVQTRMTFVIDMNLPVGGENSLIDDEDIIAFASRYLNAVRLGTTRLHEWYKDEARGSRIVEALSHCDKCKHREICHGIFGQVKSFGLYPFTTQALLNMARHKGVIQEGFNPRRLIKDVMAEVLDSHQAELAAGEFPSELLRSKMIKQGQGLAPADVDKLQRADPNHYLRQRTVLELWGALDKLVKLPDDLYEAFDLPVPLLEVKDNRDRNQAEDKVKEKVEDKKEEKPPPPPPKIDPKIEAVRNWANGAPLLERVAGDLRKLVYDSVISYIDWDTIGLERTYFVQRTTGPFRERFIIFRNQQTQASLGTVRLTIPLTEDPDDLRRSALALEGLLQFRHHQNWNFPDGEQYLVALSECLEEWSANVHDQFQRLPDGYTEWNPVPLGVELLAIGAALAGLLSTSEPGCMIQVDALFKQWPDEAPVQSPEWKKLYQEIRRQHAILVGEIQARASGTKGGQTGGFIDAASIITPLQRLQKTWTPNSILPQQINRLREPYHTLVALYEKVRAELPLIVQKEYNHKIEWLNKVLQRISLDTEQKAISEAFYHVRERAVAVGLGLDARILNQFDTARLEFEGIDLPQTLREISALSEIEVQTRLLPQLANTLNLRAIQVTDDFLQATSQLLKGIELVVQREINNLEKPGELNVSEVQQRLRNSLEELKQLLTIFGEG